MTRSLFITTNYIPVVNETDHGTWRRLALVVFPFVYRKTGEPLAGPNDRRGDAGIKARVKHGRDGQHDAFVTWVVDGARRWYESGFPPLPLSVDLNTRDWRKDADRILGFWDERLIADPAACIVTTDMLQAFNSWMKQNGHAEWSKELFGSRFKTHEETRHCHIEERRPRNLGDLEVSRPPEAVSDRLKERPHVYVGVRFRTADETARDEHDQEEWSDRSNRLPKSQKTSDTEVFPSGSDRSDHICCREGGALVPACKLCPKSPIYWRGDQK